MRGQDARVFGRLTGAWFRLHPRPGREVVPSEDGSEGGHERQEEYLRVRRRSEEEAEESVDGSHAHPVRMRSVLRRRRVLRRSIVGARVGTSVWVQGLT